MPCLRSSKCDVLCGGIDRSAVEIGSSMVCMTECLYCDAHKLRPVAAQGVDAWELA